MKSSRKAGPWVDGGCWECDVKRNGSYISVVLSPTNCWEWKHVYNIFSSRSKKWVYRTRTLVLLQTERLQVWPLLCRNQVDDFFWRRIGLTTNASNFNIFLKIITDVSYQFPFYCKHLGTQICIVQINIVHARWWSAIMLISWGQAQASRVYAPGKIGENI